MMLEILPHVSALCRHISTTQLLQICQMLIHANLLFHQIPRVGLISETRCIKHCVELRLCAQRQERHKYTSFSSDSDVFVLQNLNQYALKCFKIYLNDDLMVLNHLIICVLCKICEVITFLHLFFNDYAFFSGPREFPGSPRRPGAIFRLHHFSL